MLGRRGSSPARSRIAATAAALAMAGAATIGTAGTAAAEPFPCGDRGTCALNEIDLNVRSGPGLGHPATSRAPAGQWMALHCWTYGDPVNGDNVWYHIDWVSPYDGHEGFVAGFHLDTGRDPAPGIPVC